MIKTDGETEREGPNKLTKRYTLHGRLAGIKCVDTAKPEWIEMKPIIEVVNEALKSGGKN